MSADHCPGCGTAHHWLACPEVEQSVFLTEDPEWIAAEVEDLLDELSGALHPNIRREMERRLAQLQEA